MSSTIDFGAPGAAAHHLDIYLKSDGAEGHIVDMSPVGGPRATPCLVLQTRGRRSGEAKLVPLIYGEDGGRFVVVASKGGADTHPAWFLNLEAEPQVAFQVGPRKHRGRARPAQGAERERLFEMMAKAFEPYRAYQAGAARLIPVVILEPQGEIERLG